MFIRILLNVTAAIWSGKIQNMHQKIYNMRGISAKLILSQVEIGGRPNTVEFIDDDVFCIAGEVRTGLG